MIKPGSLMIPRSVKQKSRNTQSDKETSRSKDVQSHKTEDRKLKSSDEKVLTDVVNKTCDSEKKQSPIVSANQSTHRSFAEVISMQNNIPYVDAGAVSYNKKVPKYYRNRRSSQNSGHSGTNFHTDVAWEPVHGSRRRKQHRHGEPEHDRHDMSEVYHPRRWEYTSTGRQYLQRPPAHRGFEFTVMSYNVLAQNLLEDNYNLYHRSPSHVLHWRHRAMLLMKELKFHTPDVICLQEVNCYHYDEVFLPELQYLGYEGTYLKRTGDKLDGCATFYNKRKFDCEEIIQVPYNKPRGGALLNRDNVGLIVKLKPKTSQVSAGRCLVVSNTHLLFNPKRGDVKLAQLMILLSEIDKCAHAVGHRDVYHSILMCGDFNSQPHSDIYKLIVMGFLEYEGLEIKNISGQEEHGSSRSTWCPELTRDFFPSNLGISDSCQYYTHARQRMATHDENSSVQNEVKVTDTQGSGVLTHQLRCVSVYKHWLSRSDYKSREITTHHGKAACTVDYIFYGVRSGMVRYHKGEVQTNNVEERHLNLLARYELLSVRDLDRSGSLPNKVFGSDHLSLIAKFLLT